MLFVGAMLLASLASGQTEILQSSWAASQLTIDGRPNDWSLPLSYYDATTKLFFGLSNDAQNIYLCFQSMDQGTQVKILRAGIEIRLSAKGKQDVSIRYPLGKPAAASDPLTFNVGDDYMTLRDSLLTRDTLMEVEGFVTRAGLISIHDSSGIAAAINWDPSNRLTYEIAIPQREFFGTKYDGNVFSKDITMEITIHSLKGLNNSIARKNWKNGRHRESNPTAPESLADPAGDTPVVQLEKKSFKQKFRLAKNSDHP